VGFNVGLAHNVEAVLVAQIVETRIVGIVARAHGVDVELLHQLHIATHFIHRNGFSVLRTVVVAVHAHHFHRLTIHQEHIAIDFHIPKTQAVALGFLQFAFFIFK